MIIIAPSASERIAAIRIASSRREHVQPKIRMILKREESGQVGTR
jgi:hypothetical protein